MFAAILPRWPQAALKQARPIWRPRPCLYSTADPEQHNASAAPKEEPLTTEETLDDAKITAMRQRLSQWQVPQAAKEGHDVPAHFQYAHTLRTLDPATSRVARRLTKKYHPREFESYVDPATKEYYPAKYSSRQLADIRKQAWLCGLDPVADLNLPPERVRTEVPYVRKREVEKAELALEKKKVTAQRVATMDQRIEAWRKRKLANKNAYRYRLPL